MIYITITVGIFLLDLMIKRRVDRKRRLNEEEKVCGNKIILTKYYNKGAALNLLEEHPNIMTILHATILILLSLFYIGILGKRGENGMKIGTSMVLGGGWSNLYDRMKKKHVVDYFRFNVKFAKLSDIVFNISDLFVFLGSFIMLISGLRKK